MADDDPKEQEETEADQAHRRRRKIDSFLTLARNAQNAHDNRVVFLLDLQQKMVLGSG